MTILFINTGSDAWLRSDQPTVVQAADISLGIGYAAGASRRRPLLAFNIASLPAAATVNSAFVSLRQNSAGGWGVTVRRLLAAWIAAQATWNSRAAGIPWATPGGDFAASPTATFNTTTLAGKSVSVEVSELLAVVRAAGSTTLEVILAKTDESGGAAVTSFAAFGQANPPTLMIEYELPSARGQSLSLGMRVGL